MKWSADGSEATITRKEFDAIVNFMVFIIRMLPPEVVKKATEYMINMEVEDILRCDIGEK
jgi:hypothetical protein